MADFPRVVAPIAVTPLRYPSAMRSIGQSGKVQTRSFMHYGRMWEEKYPPLQLDDQVVRAWMSQLEDLVREGTMFDVKYWPMRTNNGVATGSPLVKGASQTGSSILVDGLGATVISKWLKAGDLIKFPSSSPISNLVFRTTADVDTVVTTGEATIPITPKLYPGWSPQDNDPVTVQNVKFRAMLPNMPNMSMSEDSEDLYVFITVGMTLTFLECP